MFNPLRRRPAKTENSAKPNVDQFVGKQLEQFRALAGLSHSDLAVFLAVSSEEIAKFEAGRRRISAAQLFQLARRLDVPVAAFFGIKLEAA